MIKKEQLMIDREIKRLLIHLSGIRNMNGIPTMVFIVDVLREDTAVHEANLLKIPIVALVDTNCDPSPVDYVIPSNDDAIRAIKLLVAKMADAAEEGKAMRKDEELEAEAEAKPVAGTAVVDTADKAARGMELADEIEDDKLLGESTLAKMTPAAAPQTDVVEEVVESVEEVKPEGEVKE